MRPMLAPAVMLLAIHPLPAQTRTPGMWVDSVQATTFRVDIVGTDRQVVTITVRSSGRVGAISVADSDARIFSESALAIVNRPPQVGSYAVSRARMRFEYVATGPTLRFGFDGDSGTAVQGSYSDVGRIFGSIHSAALWSEGMTRLRQTGSSAPSGSGAMSDTYFEFQVTKRVWPKPGNPHVHFPDSLRVAGVDGEVLAQFVVDTTGHVDMAHFRVLKSTHALFTQAVKDVLPNMEYTPAEIDGRKVRQLVQQPFTFSLTR